MLRVGDSRGNIGSADGRGYNRCGRSGWKRNWIWGRAESADKDSTLLYEETPFVLLVDETRLARVQAFTGGYERELPLRMNYVSTGVGAQLTVYRVPPLLAPIYNAHPVGVQMFFRVRLAGN